jgi:hypothetical protein
MRTFFSKRVLLGATRACATCRWPDLGELMRIRVSNVSRGLLGPEIAHLQVGHLWCIGARSVGKAWSEKFSNAFSTDHANTSKMANLQAGYLRPLRTFGTRMRISPPSFGHLAQARAAGDARQSPLETKNA